MADFTKVPTKKCDVLQKFRLKSVVETRGRRMGGRLSAFSRVGGCAFECGVVTVVGVI